MNAAIFSRRKSKAEAILSLLEQGPATTQELAEVGGIRFGARLLELRRTYRITTSNVQRKDGTEFAIYSLQGLNSPLVAG
jgi:hypothetical protein